MTPREAYRWRILCHTRDGSSAGTWSAGNHATENDSHDDVQPQSTEFDELVVGHWLHIEEMDTRVWWIDIGGIVIWVHVRKDGRPKSVFVEQQHSVDGCTYKGDVA